MLATQVAAACVLAAIPVLAPAIAADIGVDPSLVGIYYGLLFITATLVSAWSGKLIAHVGAVRTNQLALAGSGLALLCASGATLPAMALTALLVGAGYGPNTPSGSQVLIRVTPPHRRGLAFSLKQSGAPVGGMFAGLILPPVVYIGGWKMALLVVFVLAAATALAVEPLHRQLDPRVQSLSATERASPIASMRFVLAHESLRHLTTGGMALMVAHACFQTFLVAYLVEGSALSLTIAGTLYATMQAAGALARVATGWGVDRLRSPRAVLAGIALLASASALAVAAFGPGWAFAAMWGVCVLAGIGSSGWYGAFLSEVAHAVPIERAGFATGGVLFFVYGAHVAAPFAAALLIGVSGNYTPVFVVVAVLAALAAASFSRIGRRR